MAKLAHRPSQQPQAKRLAAKQQNIGGTHECNQINGSHPAETTAQRQQYKCGRETCLKGASTWGATSISQVDYSGPALGHCPFVHARRLHASAPLKI